MMSVVHGIERIVEAVGWVARWCVLLLVLLVAFNVLGRNFLGFSSVAFQEFEWHLLSPIALIGMAYTLKHRADVRVDFLYEKFRPRVRAGIDLFSAIATCAVGGFIAWVAFPYVMQSYRIGEGSPDPGGLSYRYLLKSLLVIGFGLFALQGVADTLRALCALAAKDGGEQTP